MAEKLIQTLFGEEWIELAPTCKVEGCNKPADNAGNGRYHLRCGVHHKSKFNFKGRKHTKYKKDYCENIDGRIGERYGIEGGFKCINKIIIPGQLEVDHMDGDRSNEHPVNFETLCVSCHRVKTIHAQDGHQKYGRGFFPEKLLQDLVEKFAKYEEDPLEKIFESIEKPPENKNPKERVRPPPAFFL
jgi:5-methylcytosine-specific restriction endonuclease McrA